MRVLLAVLAAAALAPLAVASTQPSVRLARPAPAQVAGRGFHPRERVRVTVGTGTAALRKTVSTTARGAFVARFTTAAPRPRCGSYVVTAVGARGDRAAWKSPPEVCGTELQP